MDDFFSMNNFDQYAKLVSLMVTPKSIVRLSVPMSYGMFPIWTPESDVTPKSDGLSPEESFRNLCNVLT